MARKSKGPKLYTRQQGGQARFYADLRPVGGGREALIPKGETLATTDAVIAQTLLAARLGELEEQKRTKHVLGLSRRAGLQEFAATHLVLKAKSGRVTDQWLATTEKQLGAAVEFFGAERDVASIGVEDVQAFAHWLAGQPNGRGGTLSEGSQRHYLNCLSNLFRRAQGEGVIRGVNPVMALMEKPTARRQEAEWLEVWEGALLLEAARTYPEYRGGEGQTATLADRLRSAVSRWGGDGEFGLRRFQKALCERGARAADEQLRAYLTGDKIPAAGFIARAAEVLGADAEWLKNGDGGRLARIPAYSHALVATFLLTGGRESEVEGLELDDVSVTRKTVTFRPNEWRRLKTGTSHRTVPLWPQLEEVLERYVEKRGSKPGLLFPSDRTGGMIADFRKPLDAIAGRAGWKAGEIRTKRFRHTYTAARLQTLDRGHPISEFTVAREMGHGGFELVRRVYGHLGRARHRSEVVEYRLEQHVGEVPKDRLDALRAS